MIPMLKIKLGLVAAGTLLFSLAQAQTVTPDEALIKKGEYLAVASDCIACHTATKNKPFAGGKAIESPVGEIISTNITPSKQDGIGNYTEQQFADALRKGVRADGANLYPAMPYTSYSVFTDEDVHALYAYFMSAVKPVDEKTKPTALPFPLNIRMSMKIWNAMFLKEPGYKIDPAHTQGWNRGRYLAEGAAHCSACHTPRGFLMQEKDSEALTGAQVGPWYAPNITADPVNGIGTWSKEDLITYLRTGRLPGKAQAAGSMAEAITNSFHHLSDADLADISEYIMSVSDANPAKQGKSRFIQGTAGNDVASFRGVPFNASVPDAGARLFSANCASCHGVNAQGTPDQFYPSLFHNSATGAPNPTNLVATILYGVERDTKEGNVFMPPFGDQPNALNHLTNTEVADLSNTILRMYGDKSTTVTVAQVAEIRQGGPTSPLVGLAQAGVIGGIVVVILLIAYIIYRRKRKTI